MMSFTLGYVFAILALMADVQNGVHGDPPKRYNVTTIVQKPFVMPVLFPNNKGTLFEGFVIDMLKKLEEILGVEFDIDLVKDGQYGRRYPNGTWTGMIGHLMRGEADIAAAALSVVSTRAKDVDFSQQYMLSGPQILMKKSQSITASKFLYLLQPLSAGVWLLALAAYVIVSFVLYAIWRWSPFEWGTVAPASQPELRQSFNIPNSFLFAFSALMWQGFTRAPRSFSGRLLTAVWWIFTLFFLVSYIAALTGRFIINASTTNAVEDIKTFDDLALSSLDYGIVGGGKTQLLFKTSKNPLQKKMWTKMNKDPSMSFLKTNAEGIQKVLDSNGQFAFIMESPTAEYTASRNCDLVVTGEPLTDDGYALACRRNGSICSTLDHALLTLKESEYFHDLRRKWFGGVCAVEATKKPVNPFLAPRSSVTLQDSGFAFVLLAIGLAASVAALALELFLNKIGIVVPSLYKEDEMRIHDPNPGM